ncbi:MAG TPA: hypothetical protein VEL76_27530 [Gemmataceae bacterium]|nr:hypothetical protein [Gemmataceae bacterium]
MGRFLKISLALSFIACAVHADEQPTPKPKPLPDELKQLHGYWVSGPKEFSKDLKGHLELRFEFKGDSAAGLATLGVVPEGKADPAQDVGPLFAEVKEKDKKRVIIIKVKDEGKFVEAAEITYELAGDKLKLTCAKKFRHPELGAVSVELSGEWKRTKPEKK